MSRAGERDIASLSLPTSRGGFNSASSSIRSSFSMVNPLVRKHPAPQRIAASSHGVLGRKESEVPLGSYLLLGKHSWWWKASQPFHGFFWLIPHPLTALGHSGPMNLSCSKLGLSPLTSTIAWIPPNRPYLAQASAQPSNTALILTLINIQYFSSYQT